MQRSPELLKLFANRLARLVSSEDGMQLAQLLQSAGLVEPEAKRPLINGAGNGSGQSADVEQVGIWERKRGTPHFVRRPDMFESWNLWANIGRIEPKGKKLRIVLIGESVTRGYLYDPQFTPAMALDLMLQSQLGNDAVEVIDLARIDLGFEVTDLAISALLLEPDAVVIFAGNNWVTAYSKTTDLPYLDAALREQGIAGWKDFFEKKLAGNVHTLVTDVGSAYKDKNVPLLWIIPEFNLGDWRDSTTSVPHLLHGTTAEWIANWEGAHRALRENDLSAASELAGEMVQLDQGVSVAGLYVLAECSKRLGNLDLARHYLESARDALIWDRSQMVSPRPYSVAQEVLRKEIDKDKVVDLPRLFNEYLQGTLPDRRLFLDYCHLTSEGIQIAMAAVASRLLQLLKKVDVPWRSLVNPGFAPSDRVEGEAAFLAAIHNAHAGQAYDLVHYHCLRSVQLWPEVAKVMTCFVDLQTRRTPMLMCQAAERIASFGSPLIQNYLLRINHQQLDRLLLDAIVASLNQIGIAAGKHLDQLRCEELGAPGAKTNLLEYYYCASAVQPLEFMWVLPIKQQLRSNDFYKAHWTKSTFSFVGQTSCDVCLSLTCRLPYSGAGSSAERTISVEVNGMGRTPIVVSSSWETWDIIVSPGAVRDGLNEVAIHWPIPELPKRQAIEKAADHLRHAAFPELYCNFGEIHSFTMTQGAEHPGNAAVEKELVLSAMH